jgi:hypothetical protein
MEELRNLISIHEIAYNMAVEAAQTGRPTPELWDVEQELSDKMQEVAENLGVFLVGYVNPEIKLLVLS